MSAAAPLRLAIPPPVVRQLGRVEYLPTWRAMERFTLERDAATPDEIWFLEHPPVFTLGMQGRREHLLAPGDIPVVQVDRGGQVTYHGPGQLVVYPLLDLRRLGLGVRGLVEALERAVIATLAGYGITAFGRCDAPGVYVAERKVAALGIRVKRGCCYHGLAFNVNDAALPNFARINPCGKQGLEVTSVQSLGGPAELARVGADLQPQLIRELGLP